jgi:stage IV sporulation protein FB
MRYTVKIGTYFGIPVRVHFTFPLILAAFAVEGWLRAGAGEAVWAVGLVLAVFVCVVLHEFGHSLQVRRYGIEVRDIVLLPIGGMARAERIPEEPRQEIIVAICGPAVNFVLAGLLYVAIQLRGEPVSFERDLLLNLLVINLVLGTFNLVPAFPMDGGRILRGILAMRMPYVGATRYAKNVGFVIAIAFAVIGFTSSSLLMLPVIAVFIFYGATSEERMVRLRYGLGAKTARDFLADELPMLMTDEAVWEATDRLSGATRRVAPVTDREGVLAGVIDRAELDDAMSNGGRDDPLERYARTGFPLVDAAVPAIQAYYVLRSRRMPLAGLVENDRFVGIVFMDDLAGAAV